MKRAEGRLRDAREELGELEREETARARRILLQAEKRQIIEAHRRGRLAVAAYDRLRSDIDARLVGLSNGRPDETEGDDAEEPSGRPAPNDDAESDRGA